MPKQILSIDVGIKNLSFCLFELNDNDKNDNDKNDNDKNDNDKNVTVLKWDNIDLTKEDDIGTKCIYIDDPNIKNTKAKSKPKSKSKSKSNSIEQAILEQSSEPCGKPAKFIKDNKCYCLKHSKLTNYIQPSADLKPSFLNKQTIQKLIDIANKYKVINTLEVPDYKSYKKAQLVNLIKDFSDQKCLSEIKKSNASKIDLVTIGRNIQHRFDEILCDYLLTIDTIIIENQIGPIANKMKTIQGMLSQYFIMKNNNISIDFISATNKLKDFIALEKEKEKEKKDKMDYKERKKMGIQICSNFVSNDVRFSNWNTFFSKHQKKDDLSDCFLQGMWYIKHNKNL
jgi:hypothetical protein